MKKICLGILTVGLLSASFMCNKTGDHENCWPEGKAALEGTWELYQVQGGMVPTVTFPEGNGNKLKFSEDEYELYENNQLKKQGPYAIVKDNTVESNTCLDLDNNQFQQRLVLDDKSDGDKVFMQVDNNKLRLISGCFALDAGVSKVYVRR